MVDRPALLGGLQTLLGKLEDDLRERVMEVPAIASALELEHGRARSAGRTAQSLEEWRTDAATQTAVAWVLSAVFARFLEDNGLIDPPRIAGPGEGRKRALDEHELYFRANPKENDRDYLKAVFADLARLPGAREVFGGHNPMHEHALWLSGDGGGEILKFFQRIDDATGALVHDFTDTEWDTRFLGDLYQDLSKAARKKYALLQTPEFVEEFILDRTLEPALEEFGLEGFRMIDPACGSGHFLLGSFTRLFDRWRKREPGANPRDLAQRALDGVHGVDLNPFAVAIARFRLLLAAMWASGVRRLKDAPAFHIQVVCGDSLLHGSAGGDQQYIAGWQPIHHAYGSEDLAELQRILAPGRYHAVVANPPYITPKDPALRDAYRARYSTCHMKYSLSVPFMQRIFDLASNAGFTGQITGNSFMKREFGGKLIEEFLPKVDLTHVIDTSGAYIPGHGTPTVILFGRNRPPVAATVRTVMGIRGEPSAPEDASRGLVWTAITAQTDAAGSKSKFVSVADTGRETFCRHPWSIGGGGAAELKAQLDGASARVLNDVVDSIGFMAITGEDDAFVAPREVWRRAHLLARPFGVGDRVRDWIINPEDHVVFMYQVETPECSVAPCPAVQRFLWAVRTSLRNRLMFGKMPEESGLLWFEYRYLERRRLRGSRLIAFAFVATHNHFVLDRGGKVFNRSAPVIKLPPTASEEDHLGLLGLLNSSTACFWMKQVFADKGNGGIGGGIGDESWERRFEFDGTKLQRFPIPAARAGALGVLLVSVAQELQPHLPPALLQGAATAQSLDVGRTLAESGLGQMIALQEELDWHCYRLYDLIENDIASTSTPPPLSLGERAFEIVLARKMAAGDIETTWFERHGSKPKIEIPAHWPEAYRGVVQRRIDEIERNPNIALIEQPEYKRRWNSEPWEEQLERALRSRLLDRLESFFDLDGRMNDAGKPTARLESGLVTVAQLADVARGDADFMRVAELYRRRPDFDVARLVDELVQSESVPILPIHRYKAGGLEKRRLWERTWELQRREDAIDARTQLPLGDPQRLTPVQAAALKKEEIGDIPVPPKYATADFRDNTFWRLRGKLDVPKERWVSFPDCAGADGSLLIAWAGYDHLQLARAIAAHHVAVQERLGGRDDPRLAPLLAALLELLPWLRQWHNQLDPEFQTPMGDYFEGFIQAEARELGKTIDEIRAWEPAVAVGSKKARRARPAPPEAS